MSDWRWVRRKEKQKGETIHLLFSQTSVDKNSIYENYVSCPRRECRA